MPTNLRLTTPNFVRSNGYFYHLDVVSDTLYKKTDDGNNAFSYPLDTNITNAVSAIQYDGRYFYTLENIPTANANMGQLYFKMWEIEDYVLRLKRTYSLIGAPSQKYDCNAFAVEYYDLTISSNPCNLGMSAIFVHESINSIEPGDSLYIGPSSQIDANGSYEEILVQSGNKDTRRLYLQHETTVNFNHGDNIKVVPKIWFFNKYKPSDSDSSGSGQVFTLSPKNDGLILSSKLTGNGYKNILAASFIKDSYYKGVGRSFVAFINSTNLNFIEVDPTDPDYLVTVESAAQNNQEYPNTAVIPIYAISHENNTIFRLQHKATYRNGLNYSTEDWSTAYNYQLTTIERLPTSISLTAENGVVSINGATTDINIIVHDQFDHGIAEKVVTVVDNDTTGGAAAAISGSPTTGSGSMGAKTNADGWTQVVFHSGTNPSIVTITATTS